MAYLKGSANSVHATRISEQETLTSPFLYTSIWPCFRSHNRDCGWSGHRKVTLWGSEGRGQEFSGIGFLERGPGVRPLAEFQECPLISPPLPLPKGAP